MSKITKAQIQEFVEAAHGNIAKVEQMLGEQPELLHLPNGNETALGAACQMRNPEMINLLLTHGAEMDISAACVLGLPDRVTEFLDNNPTLLTKSNKQAHNKKPLYFAENQPKISELLRERGAK